MHEPLHIMSRPSQARNAKKNLLYIAPPNISPRGLILGNSPLIQAKTIQ